MERLAILIVMCIITFGCADKGDNQFQENNLVGTWVIIEQREYGGTPDTDWRPVVNSYQIMIKPDGKFISDKFSECTEGKYFVSNTDNTLTFTFDCPYFSVKGLSENGIFIEKYSFDGEYLILSPTYLNCEEGCAFKFERK